MDSGYRRNLDSVMVDLGVADLDYEFCFVSLKKQSHTDFLDMYKIIIHVLIQQRRKIQG